MTPLLTCCGSSMQRTAEGLDAFGRTTETHTCMHCNTVATTTYDHKLGWTITEYHSQKDMDAAEKDATAASQSLVDAVEPWDAPVEGKHACPFCDRMTGESTDELKDGWYFYQCGACGASWQADGENTTPEAITLPTP